MTIETTSTELTPELLDLMEHEKVIEQRLEEVGTHLGQIRDGRKYRAAGYSTFEDYCQKRWGMSKTHANRQIQAAESIAEIGERMTPIGVIPPVNEAQVRPLASLLPDEKADAWTAAVQRSDGKQPTAATVTEVVNERRTPKPVPKPAPKVGGERMEGAKPHPAVYSDAVLDAFRDLLEMHHGGGRYPDNDPPGVILDPFAGTGRIHELRHDGYDTVGVEIESEWADLHVDTICGDSRDLANVVYDCLDGGHFEAVVAVATSPAYGNRLADHYDAYDPEARRSYSIDLGRKLSDGSGAALQWGCEYRSLHEAVWKQCVELLPSGGLFLLNCKDHQRAGSIEYVTLWHVVALGRLGVVPIDYRLIPPAGLSHTTAAKLPELVVAFRKP